MQIGKSHTALAALALLSESGGLRAQGINGQDRAIVVGEGSVYPTSLINLKGMAKNVKFSILIDNNDQEYLNVQVNYGRVRDNFKLPKGNIARFNYEKSVFALDGKGETYVISIPIGDPLRECDANGTIYNSLKLLGNARGRGAVDKRRAVKYVYRNCIGSIEELRVSRP